MKIKDVVVGKVYAVKVNGKIAPVRLESMREGYKTYSQHTSHGTYSGHTVRDSWTGTNLRTGRQIHIRSAAKLRYELIQLNQTWVSQKTAVAPLPGVRGAIADFMDQHNVDTIKAGSTVIKKVQS